MAEEQPQPKKQRKRTHAQTAVGEKPAAKPAAKSTGPLGKARGHAPTLTLTLTPTLTLTLPLPLPLPLTLTLTLTQTRARTQTLTLTALELEQARDTAALLTACAHGLNAWCFVAGSDCGLGLWARSGLVAGQALGQYAGPRLPLQLQRR